MEFDGERSVAPSPSRPTAALQHRKQRHSVFGRIAADAQGKAAPLSPHLWQNGSGSVRKGGVSLSCLLTCVRPAIGLRSRKAAAVSATKETQRKGGVLAATAAETLRKGSASAAKAVEALGKDSALPARSSERAAAARNPRGWLVCACVRRQSEVIRAAMLEDGWCVPV